MIDKWPYITVIAEDGAVRRARGNSDWSSPVMMAFTWQGDNDHAAGTVLVADEGVTWVRGWYNETAPEVAAMLAARAMNVGLSTIAERTVAVSNEELLEIWGACKARRFLNGQTENVEKELRRRGVIA